jgi:hypothetical protein
MNAPARSQNFKCYIKSFPSSCGITFQKSSYQVKFELDLCIPMHLHMQFQPYTHIQKKKLESGYLKIFSRGISLSKSSNHNQI